MIIDTRSAKARDVKHIVATVAGAFPADLTKLTIYGCEGVERYVKAVIDSSDSSSENRFNVATSRGVLVAACELRDLHNGVHLNYIAVAPTHRGSGVGRQLLTQGLRDHAIGEDAILSLDVFEDNLLALAWYERLGLMRASTTDWWIQQLSFNKIAL